MRSKRFRRFDFQAGDEHTLLTMGQGAGYTLAYLFEQLIQLFFGFAGKNLVADIRITEKTNDF